MPTNPSTSTSITSRAKKMATHLASAGAVILLLLACTGPLASAQDTTGTVAVRARVESKDEPKKAIGMVLSTKGSQQYPGATVSKVSDKLYDIAFTVDKSSLTEDSVATAIGFTEAGAIVFANVTPPVLADNQEALAGIPECSPEDTTTVAALNHIGPLQQLVDVRTERASFARMRLDRALTPEMKARLKKAEQVFGLTSPEEISSALPALELVDRLSRINFALKNYRAFKRQPTPTPIPEP
jgi:hypothetical protein